MVEVGLTEQGRNFTPNDCLLGDDERIWLITGYVCMMLCRILLMGEVPTWAVKVRFYAKTRYYLSLRRQGPSSQQTMQRLAW